MIIRLLFCMAFGLSLTGQVLGQSFDPSEPPPPPREFASGQAKIDVKNARAVVDFTVLALGPRQVEVFETADECGVLDVTIDVIDAAQIPHRFWRSSLGATYLRSLSQSIFLPQGSYRLSIASIQPELIIECQVIASVISRPHLLRESAVSSRVRFDFDDTDPKLADGINPSLMLALALKDYGSKIDLQSIRVKYLVNSNEGKVKDHTGRRSNILRMLAGYCHDKQKPKSDNNDVNYAYRTWSVSDLAAWAPSAIAYTSHLSSLSSKSPEDINVYCETNMPPTQDIVTDILERHGPQIVLTGRVGTALLDSFALDVAEALRIDPRQLTLSVSTDGCAGTYTLAVPSYRNFGCPESAMVSLTVQPKSDALPSGRARQNIAANSFVTVADLERGLSAAAGSRVQTQMIYADGGTVRIKTLPKKGVVVRRGRDWERLTVTLMQSLDAGKLEMTMVMEGFLASGLGPVTPSDVAFTRSIDNEHPVELQEFAQRVVTMLAKR